ncbi:WD40-repeat-containing domain protein [Mycena latifolia]|nr:WD40-repeat-containing domain protein [Mycena latifolia]
MRYRTLEIRWHDSKPISSCDFQPVPFKKARPANFGAQAYRLATAGEDNHVRVWMVHPNIPPVPSDKDGPQPRPARVEYLATLSRHSAAVNVVRFSPSGELIASAGDDGMVIIWAPSATPQTSTYGSDLSAEDLQHEKEYWKPRTTFRCTTMQVYDLAWSPTGEFLLAGSTDNAARVFAAADGKCMHEIAEHSHYVQGVAWDPLNEYIATQSSDRSMHVYRISTSKGTFEAHAVGRNTRFPNARTSASGRHSRTPSVHGRERTPSVHGERASSSSVPHSAHGERPSSANTGAGTNTNTNTGMMTPSTSTSSSAMAMFPPPPQGAGPSSRRSSFSGSNAPSSPSGDTYGRSPSPMPALPAIRTPPSRHHEYSRHEYTSERRHEYGGRAATDGSRMYGDESFSNFFRRLAFSPDGALLLTPAGTFEDPSVGQGPGQDAADEPAARGRKTRPVISTAMGLGMGAASGSAVADAPPAGASASSVYIYSRANFARPPVAQLPGHKKASVAVRFSPVLFELRPNVAGAGAGVGVGGSEPRMGEGTATGEERERARDKEESMEVDLVGPLPASSNTHSTQIAAPAPQRYAPFDVLASPALSPIDRRPPTPAASKPPTPALASLVGAAGPGTGSVFALPYRMLYAVVTMDTVAIYDTQQAGPVCLLTKLHYDEFTDLTWSPDGQCLMLSSRDGYCTLITFDVILPTHHTQQAALQLQQIAAQHSVPISYVPSASGSSSSATPSGSGKKRPLEPLTPAASVDGDHHAALASSSAPSMPASTSSTSVASLDTDAGTGTEGEGEHADGPPKKKRRVALTRVGDL